MEVRSTIMKTFKRFTIPRSASAIDTFTTTITSNGSTNIDENLREEINNHPSTSHVQPFQTHHHHHHHSEQNLTRPTTTKTRPVSGDISTLIMQSTSNDFAPKKSKVSPNDGLDIGYSLDLVVVFLFVLDGFK